MPLRRAPTSAKPFSLVTPAKVIESAAPGADATASPVSADSPAGAKPDPDVKSAGRKVPDPQA